MSKLYAHISDITMDSEGDSNKIAIRFSVWDDDDAGAISFTSEINLAHACFLTEFSAMANHAGPNDAYTQMLHAFVAHDTDKLHELLGVTFESE